MSVPTLKDSIDPIGDTKMGHLLKIAQIGREQECVMHEGNRCNLEVHRPNADALGAQALQGAGGLRIKRHDMPARKEVTQPEQLLVGQHLSVHILYAVHPG